MFKYRKLHIFSHLKYSQLTENHQKLYSKRKPFCRSVLANSIWENVGIFADIDDITRRRIKVVVTDALE